MGFEAQVVGLPELKAALAEFGARINDFGPLWARIAELMVEIEVDQFETEGHGAWPPLAESTLAYKESHGYPPDPLIRTGDLFESLTDPVQAMDISQGRSTLGTFTPKVMMWGTDVEYAHFHQGIDEFGEPHDYEERPPLRPVIDLGPAEDARIYEAMRDFARDVLLESGLGGEL